MARIEGVDPARVADEYSAKVLAAQAKTWGAPLDGTLTALLNRRVAALNGCEF